MRIIAPQEKEGTRWIRVVASIELVKLPRRLCAGRPASYRRNAKRKGYDEVQNVWVLQHTPSETLGTIAEALRVRGGCGSLHRNSCGPTRARGDGGQSGPDRNGRADGCLRTGQVPFSGRQGLRRVFSNPHRATAFLTQGSEPYGRLGLRAYRIFSISSFRWGMVQPPHVILRLGDGPPAEQLLLLRISVKACVRARPGPVLGLLHQPGALGVPLHVANQGQERRTGIDGQGLITALITASFLKENSYLTPFSET